MAAADVEGEELELLVGGRSFTGWERVEVSRSLEAASGSFALEVSGRGLPIRDGDEVEVRLASTVVLRGFVDEVRRRGTATERVQNVAGRDRTADLVDCSELSEPGEWRDLDLQQLVELVAAPFGVPVRSLLEEELEPFRRLARQSGDTAWTVIERAGRLRGVLVHSDGLGGLVLERPGRTLADVELVEGRNVLQWDDRQTSRDRFSSYVVRGQFPGSDDFYGVAASSIEATAADPSIARFRPLLVLAEGAVVFQDAADRARWEATVRAARAHTLELVVPGWRQNVGGRPWALNELVHVLLPGAPLDEVLLVNDVVFAKSLEEGTTTTLRLTRRDAYDPRPEVDPADEFEFDEDEEG